MRRPDGELIIFWTLPVVAIIWISAFFLFPGFVHPMSPSMSAEEVANFYRDETARIRYSMILFNWFGVGLIPIVILLAMQIRRMAFRTPILTYSLIACAGGPPTLFLIANMFWLLGSFRPNRAPELTQLLNDLAWLTFTVLVPYLIAQCLLLALAIFWDRQDQPVFRGWVAVFNLLVAAALAPAAFTALAFEGPIAWDGVLSFWVKNIAIAVWIVVMGVVLGQTIRRQRTQDRVAA
ncbi:MAG: hypothetical protein ABW318_08035 [Vicinamibacterales bacterium]